MFFFTLLFINDGGTLSAQWIAQTAPTGTTNLYSVYAISPTSVACAGATRIVRSLDGGLTWTAPISIGGALYSTIHSGVSTSWFSLGQNTTWKLKVGNPGGITLSNGPDSINALHFNTPGCITAVGIAGKVETSCDSGATWQTRVFSGLALNSVWYADANIGVACGVFGTIRRTVNGGTTWANIISPSTQNFNGVTFADSLTGYIVGNAGAFLKSTDAGATWTSMPLGIANNLNGVYFISTDTGYVVGSAGLIKKTVDGGVTWSTMVSGTTQILRGIHFTDHNTGWACGDGATILKYCPTLSVTGNITGTTIVCVGDTLTYTIPPVTGAIGYSWTKPPGWSGTSTTTTITVVAGITSGNITVAATNTCGNGTPATLAITNNSPAIPTITQAVNLLTSSATTNNQWYLNGAPITGATGQTYNILSNGTYTVVVTSNGCSSTSLPLVITNLAVNELSNNNVDFTIYPNPCSSQATISFSEEQKNTSIKLVNVLGECIQQLTTNNKQLKIDMSNVAKGIYFIEVMDEKKNVANKKIIVQ